MTPAALSELIRLSQAQQDADAAHLQIIHTEEKRLRAQLAALDCRHKTTQSLNLEETLPQRRLGVDMLWQVWVGRRRRDLQIQLAHCLARKGAAKRALQKSFGKRFALERVFEKEQLVMHHAEQITNFSKVTQLGILHYRRS
ncbi:MAG: hypothetical protein AAFY25_07920 [Pseudomonadota bacterium]